MLTRSVKGLVLDQQLKVDHELDGTYERPPQQLRLRLFEWVGSLV